MATGNVIARLGDRWSLASANVRMKGVTCWAQYTHETCRLSVCVCVLYGTLPFRAIHLLCINKQCIINLGKSKKTNMHMIVWSIRRQKCKQAKVKFNKIWFDGEKKISSSQRRCLYIWWARMHLYRLKAVAIRLNAKELRNKQHSQATH